MGHAEETQCDAGQLSGVEPRGERQGAHLLSPDGQRPCDARRWGEPVQPAQGTGTNLLHPRDGGKRTYSMGGKKQPAAPRFALKIKSAELDRKSTRLNSSHN